MTLLTNKEAAVFLRYKNPRSLYNNKRVPRIKKWGRVYYVKEILEQEFAEKTTKTPVSSSETTRPKYRIKVRR